LTGSRRRPIVELVLLALFVISFPLVAYVSTLPVKRFHNEITQWGDADSIAYQQFVDYRNKFGANEFIVITWPGCDLKDERVAVATDRIQEELAASVGQVSNGQTAYWMLCDDAGLSDSAARKRMAGLFIGRDSDSTAIAMSLLPEARNSRATVIDQIADILERSGVDPQTAHFAGLGHNLYTLDKEGLESPFRMVPWIMLSALALTFMFLRHFLLALFINALGAYTGCLAFNFIHLGDIDLNAVVWPLPTLTMLLTVSATLHFLSYYRQAIENAEIWTAGSLKHSRRVTRVAIRLAWKPMVFCALTTAIGLASLQLSCSSPVRQFGLYGGISIVVACMLTLLWLPAFLTVIRYGESVDKSPQPAGRSRWSSLVWFTHRFRWLIIVVSLLSLVVMAAGVPKIKTGSNVHYFFPANHRVIADVAAIENATGPLSSIELLLRFSNPKKINDLKRLKGIRILGSRLVERTSVDSCISAATFSPVWTKRPSAFEYAGDLARLRSLPRAARENGFLHVVPATDNYVGESDTKPDNLEETWRISCRYFDSGDGVELSLLCEELRSIATEVFFRDQKLLFEGEDLEVITTGEFVLFEQVDRQFFTELMKTYFAAFVLISIVVLFVLRTPVGLLLALPPNLFPAVMVLGAAGHLGYALDAASLMTASVALGIAVDDTLHFMLWWKDCQTAQPTADDSIERAMRYSGTAMVQTSWILGLSIVLYAFCGFLPTVRFGLLLCGMMFAALIGDLILLPALLATQSKPTNA